MKAELAELIDTGEDRLLIARLDENALPASTDAHPPARMNGQAIIL